MVLGQPVTPVRGRGELFVLRDNQETEVPVEVRVGIAQWRVAASPLKLITVGLGSCVGVTLFDSMLRLGGMVHIMLADSTLFRDVSNPAKFADTGVPLLVEEMLARGASRLRLQAKMAGGSQMFQFSGAGTSQLNIGPRNVEQCRKVLGQLGIRVVGEDIGGSIGRTMILETRTGAVTIRSKSNSVQTF